MGRPPRSAAAEREVDREWYDADEGGHCGERRRRGGGAFVGDPALFAKREAELRRRVNHKREARRRDADR